MEDYKIGDMLDCHFCNSLSRITDIEHLEIGTVYNAVCSICFTEYKFSPEGEADMILASRDITPYDKIAKFVEKHYKAS